jgi:hypothetical protein
MRRAPGQVAALPFIRPSWVLVGGVAAAVAVGVGSARSPAATGLVLAVALLCTLPAWTLLALTVLSLQVQPFIDTSFISPFQVADVLLLVFVARGAAHLLIGPHPPSGMRNVSSVWLLLFLGWAWASLAAVGSWDTALALGRVSLYGAAFFFAARDESLARPLLYTVVVSAAAEVAFGVVRAGAPDTRLVGTYGDPHQLGILLLAALPVTLLLPRIWVRVPALVIVVAGLFLTYTRGIWIAGTAELALLALPFMRRYVVRVGLVAAVVTGVALWLQERVSQQFNLSAQSLPLRVRSWETALSLIRDDPVLGSGWAVGLKLGPLGTPPYNVWLNLGASTGVPGVLLFIVFVGVLTWELARSRQAVARATLVFLAGFLVLSLGEMTLYAAAGGTILFFIVSGSGLGATLGNIPAGQEPPSTRGESAGAARFRGSYR